MTTQPHEVWTDERITWYADSIASSAWEHKHIADAMRRVRDDMQARIAELEQERRAERRLFEDLTPGGSEFHDSPKAVARWLKAQLEDRRLAVIVDLKRERDQLKQQLQQAQAEAAAYDEIEAMMWGESDGEE